MNQDNDQADQVHDQPVPRHIEQLFAGIRKYPKHFNETMTLVYVEMMKQANMTAAYFGLTKEQMRDVLHLVEHDFARDIARE